MAVGSRPLVPSRLAPGGIAAHAPRRTPTTVVGAYIALTKPRIIELLLITTIPTMVLAQKGWHRRGSWWSPSSAAPSLQVVRAR